MIKCSIITKNFNYFLILEHLHDTKVVILNTNKLKTVVDLSFLLVNGQIYANLAIFESLTLCAVCSRVSGGQK